MNRYQISKVNGLAVKKPFITFVADYVVSEYGKFEFYVVKKNWFKDGDPELVGSFYFSGEYLVEKL